LTTKESALIISFVFAGALAGTLILGPFGDVYGRRPIYLVSSSIVSLGGLSLYFVRSYMPLLIIILIIGFGVGGLTIPFDIFAEFLPSQVRGRFLLLIEYFWTLGTLIVSAVAYYTIGMGRSWNIFALLCSIPCLLGTIIGMVLVPESPHWLASHGRTREALKILKKSAIVNSINPDHIFPADIQIRNEKHENSSFSQLLKPKWRKITILLWCVWFGLAFGYYGTVMTVTRVFHSDDNETGVAHSFDYKNIFINCTAEIIGTTLAIQTIDKYGRIKSQALFYSWGGISVFLLCMFSNNTPFASLLAFLARAFEMSATCSTWVVTPEVFDTEVRSTGHSSANAIARIGGILTPFLVESDLSLPSIGIILLFIHLFVVVAVLHLPETMGKQLGRISVSKADESFPLSSDGLQLT